MLDCHYCRHRKWDGGVLLSFQLLEDGSEGSYLECEEPPLSKPFFFTPDRVAGRYCQHHVYFLLRHYRMLNEGFWPTTRGGFLLPPPRKGKRKPGAYFETTMDVMAEFNARLERTGQDGEILLILQQEEFDIARMVRLVKLPYAEVQARAGYALRYLIGSQAKRTTYADYKKVVKYQQRRKTK